MLASPLPIYLGCAGLIVGTLGLGAHHMLGGGFRLRDEQRRGSGTTAVCAVRREASLPTYALAVDKCRRCVLRTDGGTADAADRRSAPRRLPWQTPQAQSQRRWSAQATAQAHCRNHARFRARWCATFLSRRHPPKRARNDARAGRATASTEQVDPREHYASADAIRAHGSGSGTTTQADTERRDTGRVDPSAATAIAMTPTPRMRVPARTADALRSRMRDRRGRDGERRVVVREETGSRSSASCADRNSAMSGFSPFRLFGIFDRSAEPTIPSSRSAGTPRRARAGSPSARRRSARSSRADRGRRAR